MNLDRFDGYPNCEEQKPRMLSVFEMWQAMGYDPADDAGPGPIDALAAVLSLPVGTDVHNSR